LAATERVCGQHRNPVSRLRITRLIVLLRSYFITYLLLKRLGEWDSLVCRLRRRDGGLTDSRNVSRCLQKASGRHTSTRGAFFAAHWGMCHAAAKVFMPVKKSENNFLL
jgi:hypothetical protein